MGKAGKLIVGIIGALILVIGIALVFLVSNLDAIVARSNDREGFRAALLAGSILQDQGQWAAAERRYREALAFDPEDRDLRRRLALVRGHDRRSALGAEARGAPPRDAEAEHEHAQVGQVERRHRSESFIRAAPRRITAASARTARPGPG